MVFTFLGILILIHDPKLKKKGIRVYLFFSREQQTPKMTTTTRSKDGSTENGSDTGRSYR